MSILLNQKKEGKKERRNKKTNTGKKEINKKTNK
jgi:hypothetical protein